MELAGNVIALPLFMETFAFFFEAIFLGIYLYTWDRFDNPRKHLFLHRSQHSDYCSNHVYHKKALFLTMKLGLIFSIATVAEGDLSGKYLAKYQPEKLAAA